MANPSLFTDSADAEETAERFRTYIQTPLMTNINITFDGFETYDVEPSVPATLFSQRPIVLFGKWKGETAGTIQITGKQEAGITKRNFPLPISKKEEDNDAISYLWARTRLERLMAYDYSKDDPSVKEEVTKIGLDYSIMTPYTSFIAVIDVIRNPEADADDVDQALPLPLQVSNLAVGGGYRAYSEPGSIILIALMAGILVIRLFYHIKKRKQTSFIQR